MWGVELVGTIKATKLPGVIIWRPLEHISAICSKRVGNSFRGNMSGDPQTTLQWHNQGAVKPVETLVCMYPTDRPTRFFALTLLKNTLIDSAHSKTVGRHSGRTRCKFCIKLGDARMGAVSPPPDICQKFWQILASDFFRIEAFWALVNGFIFLTF